MPFFIHRRVFLTGVTGRCWNLILEARNSFKESFTGHAYTRVTHTEGQIRVCNRAKKQVEVWEEREVPSCHRPVPTPTSSDVYHDYTTNLGQMLLKKNDIIFIIQVDFCLVVQCQENEGWTAVCKHPRAFSCT